MEKQIFYIQDLFYVTFIGFIQILLDFSCNKIVKSDGKNKPRPTFAKDRENWGKKFLSRV